MARVTGLRRDRPAL